jgi:hypothetical protein
MNQKSRQDEIRNEDQALVCITCRKWFFDPANRLHIANTNECLSCEHIRADQLRVL